MTPSRAALARYQPLLYTLSGVALAYGIYLISQNAFGVRRSNTLRRSNAIRRSGHRSALGSRRTSRPLSRQEAEQLIANIRERERHRRPYGQCIIVDEGSRSSNSNPEDSGVHILFLPSQLPSENGFRESESPNDGTLALHRRSEGFFLEALIRTELAWTRENRDQIYIDVNVGQYLEDELAGMNITISSTRHAIHWFNNADVFSTRLYEHTIGRMRQEDGTGELLPPQRVLDESTENLSDPTLGDGVENEASSPSGREMLALLYHIAEDNSRKDFFVHRGVQCNGCGRMPIRGIRYRCSNCSDYDLCETCEAMQVHTRTHVFYKLRIPTPWNGGPKQAMPVWYPGKLSQHPRTPPDGLIDRLARQTGFETSHVQAFWEQFRAIAATEWDDDPDNVCLAIDRPTFNKAFLPGTSKRPPPPNLIFDRIFHFYDPNEDGLIGFAEFVEVQACLEGKTQDAKLRRIFAGYDLNGDGFVDRKDFLRMFRAWYILKREFMRDVLLNMEDESYPIDVREIILGSQPISAAFHGTVHPGHDSRPGEGKVLRDGDFQVIDNEGALREDGLDTYDRNALIREVEQNRRIPHNNLTGASAIRDGISTLFESELDPFSDDVDSYPSRLQWPPPGLRISEQDVVDALGAPIPLEEIMDPIDQKRVFWATADRLDKEAANAGEELGIAAVHERWSKRKFYIDVEEGAQRPPGYFEADSSEDNVSEDMADDGGPMSGSRPISPRSRSSSKVRFEDSVTETDYETRSNTSSRSIPVGERWGGYEISEQEKDVGSEILYQAVYEGLNELLDELFKERENRAIRANRSRKLREFYKEELAKFTTPPRARKPSPEIGRVAERELASSGNDNSASKINDPELERLLDESGYTVDLSISASLNDGRNLDSKVTEHHQATNSEHTPSLAPFPNFDEDLTSDGEGFEELQRLNNPTTDPIAAPLNVQITPVSAPQTSSAQPRVYCADSVLDPTLPQNRPNSPSTAVHLLQLSQPYDAPSTRSHSVPNGTLSISAAPPFLRHDASSSSSSSSGSSSGPIKNPSKPSGSLLARWCEDAETEAETKARGGPARLNYEEFERLMTSDNVRDDGEGKIGEGGIKKLGFVGGWVDMWMMGPLELSYADNRRFGFLTVDPGEENEMVETLGQAG
ncbi:MAG: hypothetical protein Q9227_004944 [Pyrenula ochraceoflavens]